MSSPFVPLSLPAVVPAVPGVPQLLSSVLPPPVTLAVADISAGFGAVGFGTQWGIFSASGGPILTVDSVADVEYSRDYHVSDYPQEQGAFQSYNKVQVPFQAKIAFLINGSRTDFLNGIEQACSSLSLVTVVTPEIQYPSANLVHYAYRRTAKEGVSLIRVEVWCQEIRITGTASTTDTGAAPPSPTAANGAGGPGTGTNVQSPNGSTTVQGGNVQPSDTNVSFLPAVNATGPASVTDLPAPTVGPAFVDSSGLPVLPDTVGQLTPQQQQLIISNGLALPQPVTAVLAPSITVNGSSTNPNGVNALFNGMPQP